MGNRKMKKGGCIGSFIKAAVGTFGGVVFFVSLILSDAPGVVQDYGSVLVLVGLWLGMLWARKTEYEDEQPAEKGTPAGEVAGVSGGHVTQK